MTDLENDVTTTQVKEEEYIPEEAILPPVPEAAKSDDATAAGGDASTTAAADAVLPPVPSHPPSILNNKPVPTSTVATAAPTQVAPVTATAAATAGAPPAKPPPVAAATAVPAQTMTTRRPSSVVAAAAPPPAPVPSMSLTTTTTTTTSGGRSSKKKKSSSLGGSSGQGENTGRWTAEEHRLFLEGLEQHGKGWKKIASLIKSRTVVQIRTHAQKYFQKLAKARQNGEEGIVTMEGRGGVGGVGGLGCMLMGGTCGDLASVSSATAVLQNHNKRRNRHLMTGTKRKAIQSVVASVQRQAKKMAMALAEFEAQDDDEEEEEADDTMMDTEEGENMQQLPEQEAPPVVPNNPVVPLPAVAPTLAHFVLPHALQPPTYGKNTLGGSCSTSFATLSSSQGGVISGPALEDSIFRFLTPAPVVTMEPQVTITLPTDNASSAPAVAGGGEVSPTGVMADLSMYPSWTDAKDIPTWYAKGADVDALLDVGDTLDWLADTGDMHETYQPPPGEEEEEETPTTELPDDLDASQNSSSKLLAPSQVTSTSVNELSQVIGANAMETVVPPLPSIFDGAPDSTSHLSSAAAAVDMLTMKETMMIPSASAVALAAAAAADPTTSTSTTELQEPLFDTPMEEHDFVSTILEESESAVDLAALS